MIIIKGEKKSSSTITTTYYSLLKKVYKNRTHKIWHRLKNHHFLICGEAKDTPRPLAIPSPKAERRYPRPLDPGRSAST